MANKVLSSFKRLANVINNVPFTLTGLAKRKCSLESRWLLPDFSDCVTNDYEELYNRVRADLIIFE